MAQIWQQNSALRSRYAQPTLMPTAQAVNTRVACEQLEQMAPQAGSGPGRDPALSDPSFCL